jgi:hypothetical protein
MVAVGRLGGGVQPKAPSMPGAKGEGGVHGRPSVSSANAVESGALLAKLGERAERGEVVDQGLGDSLIDEIPIIGEEGKD